MRTLPLVFAVTIVSATQAQTPRFAPGEVMARFAQGTEASAAVARAMQADPQDLRALTPAITALGARAGVPLQATRIGSGDWVILAIDSVALTERVQGQLGARENVEGITRRDEAPQLLLRFTAGSAESRATTQKLEGEADDPLERLVWSLEREVGLPLKADVVNRHELALGIDMKALTLSLVARLQALPEIDAAQPNYILRRM